MMKLIFKLVCLVSLLSSCQSEMQNSLSSENLKGKVKSVRLRTYEAQTKYDEIIKGEESSYCWENYKYEYNRDGNIELYQAYKRNDTLDFKRIAQYNEDNKMTSWTTYSLKGEKGEEETCKYDKYGNVLEKIIYDSDGEIISKYVWTINKGLPIGWKEFDDEGNLQRECKAKFDEKVIAEERIFDEDGDLEGVYIYEDGVIIKIEEYGYKEVTYTGYKRSNNKIEEVKSNSDNVIVNSKIWTKNNNDDTLRFEMYDSNGIVDSMIYTYQYEYDSRKNWIKRITFIGEAKMPKTIEERTIIYY